MQGGQGGGVISRANANQPPSRSRGHTHKRKYDAHPRKWSQSHPQPTYSSSKRTLRFSRKGFSPSSSIMTARKQRNKGKNEGSAAKRPRKKANHTCFAPHRSSDLLKSRRPFCLRCWCVMVAEVMPTWRLLLVCAAPGRCQAYSPESVERGGRRRSRWWRWWRW